MSENGPPLELEVPPPVRILDDDVGADDVGRHQIRRELDAREGKVEAARQGAHQEGLPQPRDSFEKDVPAREERDEDLVHDLVVPDDDLVHLALEFPVAPNERLDPFPGHPIPPARWSRSERQTR